MKKLHKTYNKHASSKQCSSQHFMFLIFLKKKSKSVSHKCFLPNTYVVCIHPITAGLCPSGLHFIPVQNLEYQYNLVGFRDSDFLEIFSKNKATIH